MRSPAFQMYPSDWLGSRAVRLMDAEQRGWYIQLLLESWENDPQGTLPNDDSFLRILAGVNTCSTDVEQRWSFVKNQFKQKGKLIYNARLLDEYAKQEENREQKRRAGQASAEARRAQREALKTQHLNGNSKRNARSTRVGKVLEQTGNRTSTESKPSSPTPSSSSISSTNKKEPSAHAELFEFLELKIGVIPNPGKEGKAIKWLLDHGYEVEQCKRCYEFLAAEIWRTNAVDWVTVQSQIGAWLVKGETNGSNQTGRPQTASAKNLKGNLEYLRSLQNDGGETIVESPSHLLPTESGHKRISSGS